MNQLEQIVICEATSQAQLEAARNLFLEYAASLEISLCFQNFEQELASLPGKYAPPTGQLLLTYEADQPIGCVALRQLEPQVCEMKRLYVRPAWRRHRLGRTLAERIIATARELGYASMRLDTLASLKPAISLYYSLNFQQIQPYYENPSDDVIFMELLLEQRAEKSEANRGGRAS